MSDEKKKQTSIVGEVSLAANSEMLTRHTEATRIYKAAYDGIDNELGKKHHRGLKQVGEQQAVGKNGFDCTPQQAGTSAEILDTADQNAANAKSGNPKRVTRTDDIGKVNDTQTDQVTIDSKGNIITDTGVQMKFLKDADTFVNKVSGKKYASHYPDGKFRIPADQYDGVKQLLQDKIKKLESQNLTPAKQRQLEYLKKVEKNLEKATVSKAEALKARTTPEKVTAGRIIRTSHEAGLNGAAMGAAIGGGFSIITNTVAVLKGDKDADEAVIDVLGDTAKSGTSGYAIGFANTALGGVMRNSENAIIRMLGKANAPAYIIQTAITTVKSIGRLCKGEIGIEDFFIEIGRNGTTLIGAAKGAVIGQVLIPIPVVGALVGGLVGSLVSGAIYDYTIGMKLFREEIATFREQLSQEIEMLREYRQYLQGFDIVGFADETQKRVIIAEYYLGGADEQIYRPTVELNAKLQTANEILGIPCPWGNCSFREFMGDKTKVLTHG